VTKRSFIMVFIKRQPSRNNRARSVVIAALLGVCSSPILAHVHDPAEITSAPVMLGSLSFPTSTHSKPAQAAFEQGMLWLHLFEYDHAADSFREAERLDPDFAMAYWGEAMTHTHAVWNQDDRDAAQAALAKLGATPAARAVKAPTAREKAYLDAAEKLFGPGALHERDTAFLQAMSSMAKAYPRDDEAQLFHALALLGVTRGERNIPNYLQAAAIAKRVLSRNPRHPGAAHYWIHGMDDPAHAAGALVPARALSKIAPAAGHAQHMVSHIFMALGMWQDVIDANVNAIRVVADERRATQKPMVYCGHYPSWLMYSYYQVGRVQDAQQELNACLTSGKAALAWYREHSDAAGGDAGLARNKAKTDDSMLYMRAIAVVESASDRAANGAIPLDTSDVGVSSGWDDFARGYAAARDGDFAQANAFLAALQALAAAKPKTEDGGSPNDVEYLRIMALMLQGTIAQGNGKSEEAIAFARDAARRYDALPFDFGPPVPLKPPHELVGELLLQAARPKEALAEFDLSLKLAPNRALSVQGRQRAAAAAAK
jgi:tetratricopeptide (TPR) repeat protein